MEASVALISGSLRDFQTTSMTTNALNLAQKLAGPTHHIIAILHDRIETAAFDPCSRVCDFAEQTVEDWLACIILDSILLYEILCLSLQESLLRQL
jgi:hypothetical protein